MAVVSLTGFAVQRVLEGIDPIISLVIAWVGARSPISASANGLSQSDTKKAVMSVVSFIIGLIVAASCKLSLLSFVPGAAGTTGDLYVTALVIGAGTEGANTVLKYFGYLKDSKKEDVATAALRILPPDVRLRPGQRIQLSALGAGGGELSVAWVVINGPGSGSIDSSGIYTAPNVPGRYRVMAISSQNAGMVGMSEISVE